MSDIEQITAGDINKLIELIEENIKQIKEDGKEERAKGAVKFFRNTLKALGQKKKDNPDKFASVQVE